MVLRNARPVAAGMPEVGSLPIPRYLAAEGVADMVLVSDARMSGTVVLHIAPEAAVDGRLALVDDGDMVELERRRQRWKPPPLPARGWHRLYAEHVQQAHLGADRDYLCAAES